MTAGIALLPIAVDGVTNLVLKHLPIIGVPLELVGFFLA
jgi:hypothetical protein